MSIDINTHANVLHKILKSNVKAYSFPRKSGLRFCEHCKTHKQSNGKPHVKGWRCSDCSIINKET